MACQDARVPLAACPPVSTRRHAARGAQQLTSDGALGFRPAPKQAILHRTVAATALSPGSRSPWRGTMTRLAQNESSVALATTIPSPRHNEWNHGRMLTMRTVNVGWHGSSPQCRRLPGLINIRAGRSHPVLTSLFQAIDSAAFRSDPRAEYTPSLDNVVR